jgi:hypothetical protein
VRTSMGRFRRRTEAMPEADAIPMISYQARS